MVYTLRKSAVLLLEFHPVIPLGPIVQLASPLAPNMTTGDNTSPQFLKNARTPTPKDNRKDVPEPSDLRDYFSPWDTMQDSREISKESWEVG
ncbi:hypothetical protein SK128_004269 [Halocaridina rubra]|uniref:Uncharacterized protein n=1 Tax=Halocaridina rubra TaxID=373956 RepID=A0AAN8WS91_HALRR